MKSVMVHCGFRQKDGYRHAKLEARKLPARLVLTCLKATSAEVHGS